MNTAQVVSVEEMSAKLLAMPLAELEAHTEASGCWSRLPRDNPVSQAARAAIFSMVVEGKWSISPIQPAADAIDWTTTLTRFRRADKGRHPVSGVAYATVDEARPKPGAE